MNIMFITIENYIDFDTRSIYMDLVNEFVANGHFVTVLSAREERDNKGGLLDYYSLGDEGEIYKVNIPNVTKVNNFILKGINLLRIIPIFSNVAKKAAKNKNYDLLLYNSPPITIYKAVQHVKKAQGAKTFLLLKDIWPYDCLFGGALSLNGWKKIAFDFLALLARKLYAVSDVIGCMSPANIRFLVENEPRIKQEKIVVCPNSIKPFEKELTNAQKILLRKKYNIPEDKTVFVYGGNLGVPQGIDFAIESIKHSQEVENAYFVFVGGGTEREKLEKVCSENNFLLLPAMPKDEYETLVFACDVGLIYLNHECLAPNYPSRLLAYMQAGLPVLCATDTYTDVGTIAENNKFGLWCESDNTEDFVKCVKKLCDARVRMTMGENAKCFLYKYYTVGQTYKQIIQLTTLSGE